MDTNWKDVHQKVFNLLNEEHESDPDFKFSLRKSNRYNRLQEGFWFHGTNNYLILSFWQGYDYANKTPNIGFMIFPDGSSLILLSARDYEIKLKFIEDEILPSLTDAVEDGKNRYIIRYGKISYIDALKRFLQNEKLIIDEIIELREKYFEEYQPHERIGFIPDRTFKRSLQRTIEWQEGRRSNIEIPVSLDYIHIQNYGPIKDLLLRIPDNRPHFIFFTGENGGGKTSLLRALTIGIVKENLLSSKEFHDTNIFIRVHNGLRTNKREVTSNSKKRLRYLFNGFSGYGPHRLVSTESISVSKDRYLKSLPYSSLFDDRAVLLDVWSVLGKYSRAKHAVKQQGRVDIIRNVLHDLNDKLKAIYFPNELGNNSDTLYEERDSDGIAFPPVIFSQLASGVRSIIALFGDMMVRLFEFQNDIEDVAELKGMVIIDEIDLHLHPRLQKLLIEQLAATFPKVQFIISTHSPIPLLGAPKESLIIRVDRNHEFGVVTTALNNVEFSDLLPNTILSSPIFQFNDIIPTSHSPQDRLRTEDNYSDIIKHDQVKSQLKEIAKRLKNNANEKDS